MGVLIKFDGFGRTVALSIANIITIDDGRSMLDASRVCVTGANGFIGRALCPYLQNKGYDLIRVVRRVRARHEVGVGAIGPNTVWAPILKECHAVIHLAARVHVMYEKATDPLAAFRIVNTEGTLQLARQAALAGVKRFLFVSSAKVNGEHGFFSTPDEPSPKDAYAISKWEAEQGLHELAAKSGMEVVVLRPPLVYGPDVKANFLRLLDNIEKGIPLPLGKISNQRSLIFLGNLFDAIRTSLAYQAAAGKTYFVSDGEDVSTPDLIRLLASSLGKSARLIPVPVALIKKAGQLLRKNQEVDRLLGSLVINSSAIQHDLGWRPPFTIQEGIQITVDWYKKRQSNA